MKWYGDTRRVEGHMERRMAAASVPGKRRRGRSETRWKESCERDTESAELKEEDVLDRTKSKIEIKNSSGDHRRWEKPEKKILEYIP